MELKILEVWEDGTKDIGGRRMEDGTKDIGGIRGWN